MFTIQKHKLQEDVEVKTINYSDKMWNIYIDSNVIA